MSDGLRTIQIPRANPVNAYTMGNHCEAVWIVTRRVSTALITQRLPIHGYLYYPAAQFTRRGGRKFPSCALRSFSFTKVGSSSMFGIIRGQLPKSRKIPSI